MRNIMLRFVIISLSLSFVVCAALAKPEEGKSRILNSDPLSDESHFQHGEHNADYDHEAFLGEDEAEQFDELTPEESKSRLGKIVDKIDTNGDGFVTQEELKLWIDHTQKRYILDDVRKQWKSYNPKEKDQLKWEEYKNIVYGFLDNITPEELDKDEEGLGYADMLRRDKRRWETADTNKDDSLSMEEFTDFLHPEESKHMREIVITETMEDVDKDNDGRISLEEYIGDMYKGADDDSEPSWVANERQQFESFRDKDKDGFMNIDEVRDWIIPPDYDHSDAEAKHLIFESDADGDQMLTKEEILDKYDVFVGSQATDFGEALVYHEEL